MSTPTIVPEAAPWLGQTVIVRYHIFVGTWEARSGDIVNSERPYIMLEVKDAEYIGDNEFGQPAYSYGVHEGRLAICGMDLLQFLGASVDGFVFEEIATLAYTYLNANPDKILWDK